MANVVHREDNRIRFDDRVNDKALRDFCYACTDAVERRGYQDLVLDFSGITRAYPDAVVPIVCAVDELRSRGIDSTVALPANPDLEHLFRNTNWAHYLDPGTHDAVDYVHERHLALRRYTTAAEQTEIVNAFLDILMRQMKLDRRVLQGLEWAINEITDNVLNHAATDRGGYVQVSTFLDHHQVRFVVADSGRGILASMQEAFPKLRRDQDAIGEAVKKGVTRGSEFGQGNGLAGTLGVASASHGSFRIVSGKGSLEVYANPKSGDQEEHSFGRRPRFQGTIVTAEFDTEHEFELTDALGVPHAEWDVIDADYTTDSGDALRIEIGRETSGVGSRGAGRQMRTKCMNLLAADPLKRLVIDWTGVPLVSSSFADEAIGRLFVEIGPISFGSRIQNVGMEPLVRSLVDQAILQRARQQQPPASTEG